MLKRQSILFSVFGQAHKIKMHCCALVLNRNIDSIRLYTHIFLRKVGIEGRKDRSIQKLLKRIAITLHKEA